MMKSNRVISDSLSSQFFLNIKDIQSYDIMSFLGLFFFQNFFGYVS